MKYLSVPILLATIILFSSAAFCADKPLIVVSVEPQRYFVEQIGHDLVDVSVMVRTGASPATYEPSPRQLTELSGAQAYFSIGVPFEAAWLPRIRSANSAMRIVHTDQGIKKSPMAAHDHHAEEGHHEDGHHEKGHYEHGEDAHHDEGHHEEGLHEHGQAAHHEEAHHEEGHYEHGEDAHHEEDGHGGRGESEHVILDPHIWTSPALAKTIARNTAEGLAAIAPEHAATFQANLKAFLKDIDSLDAEIRQTLKPVPHDKRTFLVFHPSWGYFARDFDLNQIPIEAEGKEPGPKALMRIIRQGRKLGADVVFVQPQFSDKSARVIASELNAKVIALDPLAEDWAENLLHAASIFKEALR